MKSSRPLLLSKPVVALCLTVAFSLAAGTAVFSAFSIREVSSAGAEVTRIQSTLLGINQLLTALVDAETGQRGYLLTGRSEYLAPNQNAVKQIPELLSRVRSGLSASPEQTAAFAQVEKLVSDKLAELANSITVKNTEGLEAAYREVATDNGLRTMDEIRRLLDKIEGNELGMLASRNTVVRERTERFQRISFAMLGVSVVMMIVGFFLFIRRVNELETILTVCAWTKRVKYNGQWVSFEDYLHKRFQFDFTHSISEDAAKKLMLEELELHPERSGTTPRAEVERDLRARSSD